MQVITGTQILQLAEMMAHLQRIIDAPGPIAPNLGGIITCPHCCESLDKCQCQEAQQ